MSSAYGPETTITAGMLEEGDWIDMIPTQSGVRGKRIQSAVTFTMDDVRDRWSVSNGRGRRRIIVESVLIGTRRGTLSLPASFEIIVRRRIAEVSA